MLDKNIKNRLLEELEVPQVVTERVKFTLDDIRLGEFGKVKTEIVKEEKKGKRIFGKGITKGVAAAACVLLVSSITVTAAVTKWNAKLVEKYQVTEKLQEDLSNSGVAVSPMQKVEQDGITMTMEQCLTDNDFFYCLFRIDLPEDIKVDPKTHWAEGVIVEGNQEKKVSGCFGFQEVSVEGYKEEDITPCTAGFLLENDEIVLDEETNSVYYYIMGQHETMKKEPLQGGFENGSGDDVVKTIDDEYGYYVVNESCVTQEDYDNGHMTFTFENLGVTSSNPKEYGVRTALSLGKWEFQWAEKKVETKSEYKLEEEIKGKCNAVLTDVTVSPFVLTTIFEVKGEIASKWSPYAMPQVASKMEMKDGSIVELEWDYVLSGYENYMDDSNRTYLCSIPLEKFIEPEDVVAVYFGTQRIELK